MPNPTLDQLAAAGGIASVAYVATNIDDIFLLLALYAAPQLRSRHIVLGQLLGIAAVIALSLAGAVLTWQLAAGYVRWLGLAPLALGLVELFGRHRGDDDTETVAPSAQSGVLKTLTIAAITVANGGDNLGVYVPMFASAKRVEITMYAGTMLALTFVWCWMAQYLVQHPKWGAPIRRYAAPATPFILVLLGLYILFK